MGSILSKTKKKESKLTYKQLYEIELNNRKMYEQQYRKKCEENVELQKGTELPKLRLQIRQLSAELQDTELLRIQETIAKETLLCRQLELKEYINKLDNNVVEKKYIEEVLNGEHDSELKEKFKKEDEEEKEVEENGEE